MENNGYPRATVITDEDRTFFRITIPCHEATGNIIADIANKDSLLKASKRSALKSAPESTLESGLKKGLKSGLKSGSEIKSRSKSGLKSGLKSRVKILEQIQNNPQSTLIELAKQTGYSRSWVAETMKRLQEQGVIRRVGSDRSDHWEIIHED